MNEVVFIRKYPSYKSGGSATVKVFTKEMFVNGEIKGWNGEIIKDRNDIQFCELGYNSQPMCSMTPEIFSKIFTKEEIAKMETKGMLYYNSKRRTVSQKYPMFSADVYRKYGTDFKTER